MGKNNNDSKSLKETELKSMNKKREGGKRTMSGSKKISNMQPVKTC